VIKIAHNMALKIIPYLFLPVHQVFIIPDT